MKDIIKNLLTEADRNELDSLISQMEAILAGKLAALTEEERGKYGSVNEQNKLLVNKVRDYRQSSPAMSSPDINWDEFESDYEARAFLESRSIRLSSIVYQMQSTKILHDYDNYRDSLKEYAYSQYKKNINTSGYAEKVAELKQFFNRSGTGAKKKSEAKD